MKKMVLCAMLLAGVLTGGCGCSGGGEFAAGSAVGGALAGTAMALQQNEEDLIARKATALEQLEKAVTETEKLAAQARVDALEKQLLKNEEVMLALKAGQAVAASDWSDPQTVSSLSTTAALLLAAWWLKKKEKS